MELKLYDTLTREKRPFVPLDQKNVRMYVCGPTVYDFAHIGNALPLIVFDVLFRLLRHLYGAELVTYVRNVTDVDDKINARAAERGDVLVELLIGFFGDLADRFIERQVRIFLRRAGVDLVVDVGDVAHVGNMRLAVDVPQQAEQHVEHDHRPRIADIGKVVDRRPADIHADIGRVERPKNALLAGQRIVEFQVHRIIESHYTRV